MSAPPAACVAPKISVLVPTYHYARYLPAALSSILAQNCRDCEILVSDDASTDGSADIIRHFAARDPRVRFHLHPRNLGMVAHWNWCLQQARGDYVKFLFGDDAFAAPHTLARLASLLDRHPSAQIAASARLLLDEDDRITGSWNDLSAGLHDGAAIISRCLRTRRNLVGEPSTVLFRRRAAARGFDPAFRQVVDLEMWFHLLSSGGLVYTDEPLGAFRRHALQQTARNHRTHAPELEMLALLRRYLVRPEVSARLRPGGAAHRLVLFRQMHYARKAAADPAAAAAANQLRAQLPFPWRIALASWHRLARPCQNLRRKIVVLAGRSALLMPRKTRRRRLAAAAFLHALPADRADSGSRVTTAAAPASSPSRTPPAPSTFMSPGKIIITGTGRAGTTFLVQLFTELGLDTGYRPDNWRRFYDEHCAAGLEHDLTDPAAPRIVKNPVLCRTLPDLLARGEVAIEHAIIPIRDLDEAARSRIWIGGHGKIPGGLAGTRRPARQKPFLAENFHRLVRALAEHDIPHTFLAFPRFACDPDYTWRKLRWLLADVDRAAFDAAFARSAHPEMIHDFSAGLPAGAGQPGREFAREKFARRLHRARQRLLLAAVVVLVAGALAWWWRAG